MNNRQRGKNTERAIAKLTGGKRVGILQGEDISHPVYSIEVKDRVKFAGEKFLLQAERNCEQGKTPIAIVHIHNKRHSEDIILMRLKDFEAHNGQFTMWRASEDKRVCNVRTLDG